MKFLLLSEKHYDEDLPKVEQILVQVVGRYYFDPIIQKFPKSHKIYPTFLNIKGKIESLAREVDKAIAELSAFEDFRQFVQVRQPQIAVH